MEVPGWKSYMIGLVCLHEMRVYIKGNFESFIVLVTWGEQCEYCENCFRYFGFINEPPYFKSLEGYG